MTLVQVVALVEDRAKVEIEATAVVPTSRLPEIALQRCAIMRTEPTGDFG